MAAETLCILGESGHGKSTSLRNLNPEETFIIATVPKPLPFKGWKKKYTLIKNDKGKIKRKKRFGKSLANKAPTMLLTIINRKLGYYGEQLIKIDTSEAKAS